MTGRYGNRSGGRGGQPGQGGRGRGRSTPSKPASKKTLEDFFFYVGSSKQASDYEITHTRTYTNNTYKAYALLWERCEKAMQKKIASRSDYENEVYNNPIKLLKAIKEHSLNYQETRYEMSIISDVYRAVWYDKQREGESLQVYTRLFKTSADIL
jgi:hypothetical protein